MIYFDRIITHTTLWSFVPFGTIRSIYNEKNTHGGVLLLVKLSANHFSVGVFHGF